MNILIHDGTQFTVDAQDVFPRILIDYKLVTKSDKKYISVDRGATTDRYASEMIFVGVEDMIASLYQELNLLRVNDKEIVLSGFPEPYFGDNVDHTGDIDCVIYKIGALSTKDFRVKTFKITFVATGINTIGTPSIPSLDCLGVSWEGTNQMNGSMVETYNRNNYFIDREADAYTFKGSYIVSKEDNTNLMAFHKTQRGTPFTVTDGQMGSSECIFGPNVSSGTHEVVIESIKYTPVNTTHRAVEIKLLRNGSN